MTRRYRSIGPICRGALPHFEHLKCPAATPRLIGHPFRANFAITAW